MAKLLEKGNFMLLSLKSDNDFNFNKIRVNKLIPFIISFLIYSATIAAMSAFFTNRLISEWSGALKGHITVEFQSNIIGEAEVLTDKQKKEIVSVIKNTAGVKCVNELQETEILKILEPWLGGTSIPDDFPFPVIFDVESNVNAKIDLLQLTERLSKISPDVKIHDHANWYAPIFNISEGLFFFAILLSVLIFCTVCATVAFIAKHTLESHEDVVKILQLIGADNFYIASQFRRYYFFIGLKASALSVFFSLLTVARIFYIYPEVSICSILEYVGILLIVPAVATITLMVASKSSVLYFLKEDKWTMD